MDQNVSLHTSLATIERPAEDLIELRFDPMERITLEGIREIFGQLDRNAWEARQWLVFLPDEPMVVQLPAFMTDLFQGRPSNTRRHYLAIVVGDPSNLTLLENYLAKFPGELNVRVFLQEHEARGWLAGIALMA